MLLLVLIIKGVECRITGHTQKGFMMNNKPRQQITLSEIRKKAKELGYKIQCNTFSTDPRYAVVKFVDPATKTAVTGNVYPGEFVAKHKAIFDYLSSIKGAMLTDRDQITLIPH